MDAHAQTAAPTKRGRSPPSPQTGDDAAATLAASSPRAAAAAPPPDAKRPRRSLLGADAAAARLAAVALHVAPFLPTVLDVMALREATRLPLTREALAVHLRAVGPATLVMPWPCAYSRLLHTKLWAVVLTRYLGDWNGAIVGAALAGGASAVADALEDVADVLSMTPLATSSSAGDGSAWPDSHLVGLGMDYDDLPSQVSAQPPLTPRLARVIQLAHPGAGAAAASSGAGAGAGSSSAAAANHSDPLYGQLWAVPQAQYSFVRSHAAGAGEVGVRYYAATACMLDASEAVAATAAALRFGHTRAAQLPAPQWIGTLAGRYEALRAALREADLPYRTDSVLCRAFVQSGCSGAAFSATCSATSGDDDASALAYAVETMAEMRWLHAQSNRACEFYRDLVASHRVYPDAYDSQAAYSTSVRAAKLRATEHALSLGAAPDSVPPSLLRDLALAQAVRGTRRRAGAGPAKLTLTVAKGKAAARAAGGGSGKKGRGRGGGKRRGRGACFACGGRGHWAADCPWGGGYGGYGGYYDEDDYY